MVSKELYYGDMYKYIVRTQRDLTNKLNDLMDDYREHFMYISSRIKSPESVDEKMARRGIKPENLYTEMYDIIGFRIICPFFSDILTVVQKIREMSGIQVVKEKDYITNPKQSGYQSYHILAKTDDGMLFEIQIRTIALDFWAALEHKLRYKKSIKNEALLAGELKRVADNISALDSDMETLREMITQEE